MIIKVWISTHFGCYPNGSPLRMKTLSSSRRPLPPRRSPCKAHSTISFSRPPSSHLSYHSQPPLRSGRHQPKSLLCSRFPQTYRPPSSGGWIRLRCRQTMSACTIFDGNHSTQIDGPGAVRKRDSSWLPWGTLFPRNPWIYCFLPRSKLFHNLPHFVSAIDCTSCFSSAKFCFKASISPA